jgi:hypothetical protein
LWITHTSRKNFASARVASPRLNHDDELQQELFQQDEATGHTAPTSLNHLATFFDDRIISRGLWPARSPDLTPLDYFLFPYLKNIFSKKPINPLQDLPSRIVEECQRITPRILENVFENMKRRVALCIEANGKHFEHLL